MTTFAQLKYDLLNIARGGIQTDEDPISLRQIGFWIINTRAELIRQQVNKGNYFGDTVVQTLDCVDVELVDLSQCCNIKTDCVGYRTVNQIPTPIETSYMDMITRVGSVNIISPAFHLIPVTRVNWELQNKLTFNIPRAFFYGKYVYVVGNNLVGLKKILVEGIFEDPTEAKGFSDCEGQPCFSDTSVFPISNWMIEQMKTMIMDRDLQLALGLRQDTENDTRVQAGTATPRPSENK